MKLIISAAVLCSMLFFSSCYYINKINEEPVPSFEKVKGIKYSEIQFIKIFKKRCH